MSETKPGRGSDQFPLRLPDGMRDRIKAAASDNGRSMNSEIVAALEEKYPERDPLQEVSGMFDLVAALAQQDTKITEDERSLCLKEIQELKKRAHEFVDNPTLLLTELVRVVPGASFTKGGDEVVSGPKNSFNLFD